MFDFVVLGLVSSLLCQTGNNVSKMTYFVSSGTRYSVPNYIGAFYYINLQVI